MSPETTLHKRPLEGRTEVTGLKSSEMLAIMESPTVKLIIVGDTAVGKSSLLAQFVTQGRNFPENHISTIGVDTKSRSLHIEGQLVKVQVWDTAGQERFATLARSFFRSAQGVLVAYDCTSQLSYKRKDQTGVSYWLDQVRDFAGPEVARILVANKADMTAIVQHEEGGRLAHIHNIPFLATSALTYTNVEEAFITLTRQALSVNSQTQGMGLESPKRRRNCCR